MSSPTLSKWENKESIYYKTFGNPPISNKIAAFDLDSTLVYTPSFYTTRGTTPRPSGGLIISPTDYILYSPKVIKFLSYYHEQGYVIVIFSNQKGPFEAGLLEYVKARMDNIFIGFKIGSSSKQLPLHAIFSTKRDKYRKPKPGMFDFFKKYLNNGIEPDLNESFYVGDAAGRTYSPDLRAAMAKNLKAALDQVHINYDRTYDDTDPSTFEDLGQLESLLVKDHSKCDLLFSNCVNLKFYTPEEFFEIY